MTQCDKIQIHLSLSALGDLSEVEQAQLHEHLAQCHSCHQEFQNHQILLGELRSLTELAADDLLFVRQSRAIRERLGEDPLAIDRLVGELKNLPIVEADDAFFSKQGQAIFQSIVVEGNEAESWDPLIAELKRLPQTIEDESFFGQQRHAILSQINLEATDSTHSQLAASLKSIELSDPGDLFFRRQAKKIRSLLPAASQQEGWRAWTKPLAVAAALFFLVIGVSRVNRDPNSVPSQQWRAALEFMANEEEDLVGLETIDELNHDQLERLANNIEGRILVESGEQWIEEPVDLDDLNEHELQLLIQRLENKVQT